MLPRGNICFTFSINAQNQISFRTRNLPIQHIHIMPHMDPVIILPAV